MQETAPFDLQVDAVILPDAQKNPVASAVGSFRSEKGIYIYLGVSAQNSVTENVSVRQAERDFSRNHIGIRIFHRFRAYMDQLRTEGDALAADIGSADFLHDRGIQQIIMADKGRHEFCGRFCIQFDRAAGLFHVTLIHQVNYIRHDHGLVLVMGNENSGNSQFLLDSADLNLQGMTQ
jgi:hypothetical protein